MVEMAPPFVPKGGEAAAARTGRQRVPGGGGPVFRGGSGGVPVFGGGGPVFFFSDK